MANLLLQKAENANATVTVVHSRTQNIAGYIRQADILIAAIGKAFVHVTNGDKALYPLGTFFYILLWHGLPDTQLSVFRLIKVSLLKN